jgi:hypothetical protein
MRQRYNIFSFIASILRKKMCSLTCSVPLWVLTFPSTREPSTKRPYTVDTRSWMFSSIRKGEHPQCRDVSWNVLKKAGSWYMPHGFMIRGWLSRFRFHKSGTWVFHYKNEKLSAWHPSVTFKYSDFQCIWHIVTDVIHLPDFSASGIDGAFFVDLVCWYSIKVTHFQKIRITGQKCVTGKDFWAMCHVIFSPGDKNISHGGEIIFSPRRK